jgi:formamidopyrimidine-DNA glycosylase
MPELPEIETLAGQLRARITGSTIEKARASNASILNVAAAAFARRLAGQKIAGIIRQGKYIGLDLGAGRLWFHLGMSGQLILAPAVPEGAKHVHVVMSIRPQGQVLYFRDPRRFGRVLLHDSKAPLPKRLVIVGPDPFQVSADDFAGKMRGRSARIKSLLLNQTLVAGLGNIYADESLHRAGIDPRKRANRLPLERLLTLHAKVCETLAEALACGGSTIEDYRHLDGNLGGFQKRHRVYGKLGKPCPACATPIRRVVISGRSSYFCPACQKP